MKQSKISRRSFLLGLGAVSAAAVLTACGGSSSPAASGSAASGSAASGSSVVYRTLDEIKASGTINIGVFSDKNPFGYVDENGEYQGYDVYFGNRLGEDLGVEINYVSTEAANRIEYLQTGKVDVILANFTVTPERAEEVDFALPYMNVALGVISPDSAVVTTLDNWNADDQMIVISGTTAETYLTKEYPDILLQKYDSYATAKNALENGNGVAWANDNTEVIAFANQNPGYTVGIASLGSQDTIAPAVSQGNTTVLDWLNEEIQKLGEENFFHKDYEATLVDTYGIDYEDELVVEGGVAAGADASSEAASSEAASSEAAASSAAAQESILASTRQERAGPFLPFSLHHPPERAILEQKTTKVVQKRGNDHEAGIYQWHSAGRHPAYGAAGTQGAAVRGRRHHRRCGRGHRPGRL